MALEKLPKSGPKTVAKNFRASHGTVEALNRLHELLERPKVGIVEELLFRERDGNTKGPWTVRGVPRKTQLSFTISDAAARALVELSKRHGVTQPDILEGLIERELNEQLVLMRKKR